ncbi:hypothetical protein ULMS_12360 [Patiriisocius marinistellae]|uniref:Curli production assembly/transport component CsgE n=1 Tax=Patiriisocius marinistellae TaxID=2494560 RepID=A0A5J4FWQ6_9FLAO|nr:CsgE family curli-type amyloid fiber assembly protein [Patiriisocius marinistellae]GEQ85728.1 hypothetical protein ULMS_12360 [Patiriisocius marinistellae]
MKSFLYIIFIISIVAKGQYNTIVKADLLVEENTEFTEIKARANNLVEVNQDLRFVFSIIKTISEDEKLNKTDEEGGFFLKPFEKKFLGEITIPKTDKTKIIILLLVYDAREKLIGKARWSQFDEESSEKVPIVLSKEEIRASAYNDALISGIVTQDTRTKFGNDFYKIFYAQYFLSEINAEEIIDVKEVLALGRNTKIEVRIDGVLLSEFFLRPKEQYLKYMSQFTIDNIVKYLQNKKNMNNQIERY